MSFFDKLKNKLPLLSPGGAKEKPAGRGILLFEHTGEVIRAEKALKAAGFDVAVKAPPPALRTGCDLVIEFPLLMEPAVREVLLVRKLVPMRVCPLSDDLLEPVSLFQHKDYGAWLMVRAANMKITVDKASRRIVNVSGGGCPDVPYLASLLMGKSLDEAQIPLNKGQTLCGYALQLAFNEAKKSLL
ncbi:MAG: DUF3343 domain-containing protein [Deltaproteobacteria bacterium]|jgi:hypothetical protein|nr:DUF3343 domain-containing protein [Deltaproteobacteria bacterium]